MDWQRLELSSVYRLQIPLDLYFSEEKFMGRIIEDVLGFISNYEEMIGDYELEAEQILCSSQFVR